MPRVRNKNGPGGRGLWFRLTSLGAILAGARLRFERFDTLRTGVLKGMFAEAAATRKESFRPPAKNVGCGLVSLIGRTRRAFASSFATWVDVTQGSSRLSVWQFVYIDFHIHATARQCQV